MEAYEVIRCTPLVSHVCTCKKEKCSKWKYVQPPLRKSFAPHHPTISNVSLSNQTTSKLSFQDPCGFQPRMSFKPMSVPPPFNFPIGAATTNSLSYLPTVLPAKEQYPWAMRRYVPSKLQMARDTIYKMSYKLPGEFVRGCNNCGCLE
ncbi:hypothetical protein HA402_001216 [Bradysia odoriphaga]|nr:hypothetical protein HA402_001216 [Bradysia odoriphaga]